MALKQLERALQAMEIQYDEKMLEQLEVYRKEILSWNEKVNLTAITDPEEFEVKHFVDSILCGSSRWFLNAETVVDIGTGAGFPGVPLAILFPSKKFYLMDSLRKRIRILEEVCQKISLENVHLYHGRAEELANQKEHREQYDLCVSRAVADLAVLSEYCLPFVKVGGCFAAYKSLDGEEELKRAEKAIEILGGRSAGATPFDLDGIELKHQILWIEKVRKTLTKYPRKAGTPAKDPLK